MSYEGYDQYICKKGHYWEVDCNSDYATTPQCPFCQSQAVWHNAVNTTNGEMDSETGDRIDGRVFPKRIRAAVKCKCKKCGTTHIAREAIYEIPRANT